MIDSDFGSKYRPHDEALLVESWLKQLEGKNIPQTEVDSAVRGYKIMLDAAKDHLGQIFKDRDQSTPEIIKPERLSWEEFTRTSRSDAVYFNWGFTDANRERAEKIGIKYTQKVVDAIPANQLKDEIEYMRDEVEGEAERGGSYSGMTSFDPEKHYMAELHPIIPDTRFLNHDRGLYADNIFDMIYLRYLGDGQLQVQDPLKEVSVDTLTQTFGERLTASVGFYVSHLRTFYQRGVLGFPSEDSYSSFTYLKKYYTTENKMQEDTTRGEGMPTVRFQIDVQELLKYRNIFADPEQLLHGAVMGEYGRTFMVPGGIPINTVHRWDFWQDFKSSPPMNNVRM